MKRLSWSKLFTLGALVSLGIVTHAVATAQGTARIPIVVSQEPRIPATYPTSNPLAPAAGGVGTQRAQFEGPNATDYFTFQNNFNLAANPQIAVGPEDILLVVNSQIFRTPNGNAPGVTPTTLYPAYSATGGQANAFQRAFLDNWIGEAALNQLCPTGAQSTVGGVPADSANTRSSVTCQLENATVTYDQMHGRFLVLFTAVDTGLTFDTQSQGYRLTRPRKASWVLLVSNFAVLTDQACLQGTSPGTCPVAGGNANQNPAGTFTFITPTPPSGSSTGGVNTALWTIFYGSSVNQIGGDGFGNTVASAGVGAGNINALPGIAGAAAAFSCAPGAIYATGALPSTASVCYLPTSARLGVDNDTVTITSSVINGNIPSGESSPTLNTAGFLFPDYAGTRVRVIKKSALYTGTALSAGNQFDAGFAARAAGTYYDLYTSPDTVGGTTTTGAGVPPIVYTTVAGIGPCLNGDQTVVGGFVVAPGALTVCTPMFYEPAHLRGRAMASFSNSPVATLGTPGSSQTYLIGTIFNRTTTAYDSEVYIQGIRELYQNPLAIPTGAFGTLPFYPVLQSGNAATGTNGIGTPSAALVDAFTGPGLVPQQGYRTGGAAPDLYVGDNRPHTLIFREGHLYDARVIGALSPSATFPTGGTLSTTVAYDVIKKLSAGVIPETVIQTQWQNTTAYAPMFEMPANVKLYGVITPTNLLQFIEKQFVATTYPPLAGLPDPGPYAGDLASNSGSGDPRSRETFGATGLGPIQLPAMANCYNAQLSPGSPVLGGGPNNPRAWASLFDIRCGQDATDSNPQVKDPQSGLSTGRYSYTTRGGAGIDPNDGSIWAFGAYAQKRNASIASLAHWGTYAANYKMSTAVGDEYGNSYTLYTDIAGLPEAQAISIAANVGLAPNLTQGPPNIVPFGFAGVNSTIYGTIPAGVTAPGNAPAAGKFGPNDEVTRAEMAYWIIKSQFDEKAIDDYLAATGGNIVTFVDVPVSHPAYRYIEVMARRGYTSGCAAGTARRYCPDYISTRKDLAVFMIRAKMSNVFPSVLSGCSFGFVNGTTSTTSTLFPPALTTNCATGDNFGLFVTGLNYFTDNPKVTGNDEYVFIQKMRELRITNGTYLGPANDGRNGTYTRGVVAGVPPIGDPGNLLRKQVATFMIRGFFY